MEEILKPTQTDHPGGRINYEKKNQGGIES
jgi:hypothetical protein